MFCLANNMFLAATIFLQGTAIFTSQLNLQYIYMSIDMIDALDLLCLDANPCGHG